MKIILAIIAASCIVVCTKAISCYQCQDVALKYDSAAVNDMVEQSEGEEGDEEAPPKCDSSHMTACSSDTEVCGAVSISYSASFFGVSMTGETVLRECLADVGDITDEAMEQFCTSIEESMTKDSSDANTIDFKSCKLDVCSTDNCNTQGMEKFQDDGERENYVSSETKLTISFLLIQLVSFLAVTIL